MKYIILLRGINISGKNKISMHVLKSTLEDNGYNNVITYLNSGNVILENDKLNKDAIAQNIFEIIKEKFGFEISIFVVAASELEEVMSHSPDWWGTEDKNIYDNLIFIIPPTSLAEVISTVGKPSPNIDRIEEYKNYIFWSFDLKNYSKSNWWIKTASTYIKDKITIRTSSTIKKVLEICKK